MAKNRQDPFHYHECQLPGEVRGALQDLELLEPAADGTAPTELPDVRRVLRTIDEFARVPGAFQFWDHFTAGDQVRIYLNDKTRPNCLGYFRGILDYVFSRDKDGKKRKYWQVKVPGCSSLKTAGKKSSSSSSSAVEVGETETTKKQELQVQQEHQTAVAGAENKAAATPPAIEAAANIRQKDL
ncbi:unnamed protein product, partial [Amoebophrya sp. A120]|eukprot:GSA120T00020099001.1